MEATEGGGDIERPLPPRSPHTTPSRLLRTSSTSSLDSRASIFGESELSELEEARERINLLEEQLRSLGVEPWISHVRITRHSRLSRSHSANGGSHKKTLRTSSSLMSPSSSSKSPSSLSAKYPSSSSSSSSKKESSSSSS